MLSADWAWALQALLLLLVVLIQSGVSEPLPRIDGRWHSIATLRENITREFSCQSEGWPAEDPPILIWYLNGERQQTGGGASGRVLVTSSQEQGMSNQSSSHSTFTLHARKWDRELRCSLEHPTSGETYNASVLLNVQFQPEIVRLIVHHNESSEPGLSLLLFALVHSNPPATVTFVDESGQQVTNTSDFLILDTLSYPRLTNHTLRVTLNSLPSNVSVSASNELGVTNSPLALTEKCVENKVPQSDSSQIKLDKVYLPRENMSVPSNLQLNDLSCLCKGRDVEGQKAAEEEENHSEQEHSSGLATRGFARFPIVGYIYKVSSMSSDEVWL
ncbi:transmembrane protein 25 isoform X2 [Polyodon spathula]|uniref:transmembrane protein 25 isoform X2 n=1 Tax=Polyodon spathula TaxID=7913 RepID=UPI001B7E20F7|nr:transmembrane protein 25 isoform X2 [Polyodon spathula]